VTDALLLDTHIALWLDSGSERLRPSTRLLIDACWQNGGSILLSAVSAWEIALLVDTGRIFLDLPVEAIKPRRGPIGLIAYRIGIRGTGC
jgi:PIN domain nuclease of toxin-antitoxin system